MDPGPVPVIKWILATVMYTYFFIIVATSVMCFLLFDIPLLSTVRLLKQN